MRLGEISIVGVLVLGSLCSSLARAEAPAATPSDENPSDMSVKMEKDKVEVTNKTLKVRVSGYQNEAKENGVSLRMRANKKYVRVVEEDGEFGSDRPGPNQVVDMGVEGRIDYNADTRKVDVLEGRGPQLSIAGGRWIGRYDSKEGEYDYESGTYKGGDSGKPWATAELKGPFAAPIYKANNRMGTKEYGADAGVIDLSWHMAYKMEGIPMDFCGHVKVLNAIFGKAAIDTQKSSVGFHPVRAELCYGFGLGKAGRLRNTTSFDYGAVWGEDDAKAEYAQVSNTVGLEKIGGLPLGIGYTYEYNDVRSRTKVEEADQIDYVTNRQVEKKHMVNLQVAF